MIDGVIFVRRHRRAAIERRGVERETALGEVRAPRLFAEHLTQARRNFALGNFHEVSFATLKVLESPPLLTGSTVPATSPGANGPGIR